MFKKILVPLDGSPLAEYALKPAIKMAEQEKDSTVFLFRVVTYEDAVVPTDLGVGVAMPAKLYEQAKVDTEKYLYHIAETCNCPERNLQPILGFGDEASAIVDLAIEKEVDLIVMSTHGRSGIARWFLGSIAERVLQKAPCPVLILRGDTKIENILITLDGSELAEEAIAPTVELAQRLGAHTTLLSVQEPIPVPVSETALHTDMDYYDSLAGHRALHYPFVTQRNENVGHYEANMGQQVLQALHHHAENYVTRITHQHPSLNQMPTNKLSTAIRSGNVAESILTFAQSHSIDLIAMATHGRSGLQRWIYGSITEKILRQSSGAMLVVRPAPEKYEQQQNKVIDYQEDTH